MAFWNRKQASPPPPTPEPPSSDHQSTEFLSGDSLQDRRSVEVLLEAIAKVSESRDLEALLDYVVDRSVEVTGAERGLLVLYEDGAQVVRVARKRGGEGIDRGDLRYSTTVVQRVLDDDAPIRTTVHSDAEALELGTSVFDLKLRAVMCVPLNPEGDSDSLVQRGALYVDSKAATREFKDKDLSLFFALATHIAIALENARLHMLSLEKVKLEQSMEIATEIQSGLMPKTPTSIPGLDVYGWYLPAEHASGDFYDFIKTKAGHLAVVVGDVTGHGIGPALITATAQSSLRAYVRLLEDPAAIVTMMNQDLAERMDAGMFLTLFMAYFTDDGHLKFVNAGGTPPLVWRQASGTIESISGTGPAVGMMADTEYEEGPVMSMSEGDILFAFTDGLVEARHVSDPDRLFGDEGMRAVVADVAASGRSAREMTEEIVRCVREFSGGVREDDMTVVVVRRSSAGA
ncbi:MAG: GAF domain-containing protein [Planctomycetota bacterium]|nr:MAG: GAF domain-containing protein [Planctomycetota bacterium]